MGKVDTDEMRARPRRSGDCGGAATACWLVAMARIELFVSNLDPLDRLIALSNQALRNARSTTGRAGNDALP